jgi:DNA-binding MarR family transcriptional regulator
MQRDLFPALMAIVGMLNSARYDDILLAEAGIALDRALFPLLVRIDVEGPLGVTELADRAGRDHSTVSRQVAKLETLGLVTRHVGAGDRRVRAASITPEGRRTASRLAAARERLIARLLDGWTAEEVEALGRLNRRLAESMARLPRPA